MNSNVSSLDYNKVFAKELTIITQLHNRSIINMRVDHSIVNKHQSLCHRTYLLTTSGAQGLAYVALLSFWMKSLAIN